MITKQTTLFDFNFQMKTNRDDTKSKLSNNNKKGIKKKKIPNNNNTMTQIYCQKLKYV